MERGVQVISHPKCIGVHMKIIGIASDLGHAVRTLRREPAFALPAILILGLGLGGTAAVFSLVNGVLLKPLPYAEPDRLVTIREVIPQIAHLYPSLPVNAYHFVEWRKECRSLQSMAAFMPGTANLSLQTQATDSLDEDWT